MSYKNSFGDSFKLGFDLASLPFLIDQSWHNDACPSFHFTVGDDFYLLWVDFENPDMRESEGDRYNLVEAHNHGDDEHREVSIAERGKVLLSTDDADLMVTMINRMRTLN